MVPATEKGRAHLQNRRPCPRRPTTAASVWRYNKAMSLCHLMKRESQASMGVEKRKSCPRAPTFRFCMPAPFVPAIAQRPNATQVLMKEGGGRRRPLLNVVRCGAARSSGTFGGVYVAGAVPSLGKRGRWAPAPARTRKQQSMILRAAPFSVAVCEHAKRGGMLLGDWQEGHRRQRN